MTKEECIQWIIHIEHKFKLDVFPDFYYARTSSLHIFGLFLGPNTRIKDVLALELEYVNVLGEGTTVTHGEGMVKINVPREDREKYPISNILDSTFYRSKIDDGIMVAVGEDLRGQRVIGDMIKWKHLMLAGATGGGKSMYLHTFIYSLIKSYGPDTVQLILCDHKDGDELGRYAGIKHLVKPVSCNVETTLSYIAEMDEEMSKRNRIIGLNRDIQTYNKRNPNDKLPHLIFIIDEYADIMTSPMGSLFEDNIKRLAAKGRSAGVHLVITTQNPIREVVGSVIKANIPTVIAFRTKSGVNSKVILDEVGAENLLGEGDLILKDDTHTIRCQGCYIDMDEIDTYVKTIQAEAKGKYIYNEESNSYTYTTEGVIIDDDTYSDDTYSDIDIEDIKLYEDRPRPIGYTNITNDDYRLFYIAAYNAVDKGKCAAYNIRTWCKKSDDWANLMLERLQREGIVSIIKKGKFFPALMTMTEFKNKYMEATLWQL